jgi:hypothetical protein
MKDTSFFRSEFKGGPKGEDYFNLIYTTLLIRTTIMLGLSKLK